MISTVFAKPTGSFGCPKEKARDSLFDLFFDCTELRMGKQDFTSPRFCTVQRNALYILKQSALSVQCSSGENIGERGSLSFPLAVSCST